MQAVTRVRRYRKQVPEEAEEAPKEDTPEDVDELSSEEEEIPLEVSKEELDGYQEILEALSSDEEQAQDEKEQELEAEAEALETEPELVRSDEEPVPEEPADLEASSDSEGGELDLEACDLMISDDDDECMEPVDVSDEDFDYDDFDGEEDFEGELDLEDYEEDEELEPLKLGFSTWLACWEQDLHRQLSKPRAAQTLRQRVLLALQEASGERHVDRNSFWLQWEHSVVFEDCPPLLGFVSKKDAELLLHCEALADLKLSLAWSEEVERRPKPPLPRQIRLERSRSRDSRRPKEPKEPARQWPEEIMSFPEETPKVALDRDGVLVVYKPAFWTMTTCKEEQQRTSSRYSELQDWIRKHLGYSHKFLYHNDRAGLIHRLDVQTSGPIVCGSNPRAFGKLRMSLHMHKFYKEYIALMHGALPVRECCGSMDYPLLTTRERGYAGWRTCVDPMGQQALTRYEAVAAYKYSEGHGKTQRYTLVRLELITGKTHQIRVHLMELARRNNLKTHGIVGDYKYLPPRNLKLDKRICRRVFLHCYRLHFPMPFGEELCKVRCPLPSELQAALKSIDLDQDLTRHYRRQCRKSRVMERDHMLDPRKMNIPGLADYDFWRDRMP